MNLEPLLLNGKGPAAKLYNNLRHHSVAMPSNLSDYLAKNYLIADPKPSKKRKRKEATSGLIIADDDDSSWATPASTNDDGFDGPVTVSGTSAEFRRAKKSNWKTLGEPSSQKPGANDADSAAADAILASAAAESRP